MTTDTLLDETEAFEGYIQTTQDSGLLILAVTITICVLLNALLPCFIACGEHREKKRLKRIREHPWAIQKLAADDDEEAVKDFMAPRVVVDDKKSIHSFSDTAGHVLQKKITTTRSQIEARAPTAPSVACSSRASAYSHNSISTSIVNHSAITGLHGKRSRTQRRFRKALEKRVMLSESGVKADSFFRFDRVIPPAYCPAATGPQHKHNHDDDHDDDKSFLSKMDTDEVSVNSFTMDAQHEDFLPKQFYEDENEVEITCCGVNAWWKPHWVLTYFDRIVALSEWDFEMRKIMKLTLPFAAQALFTGAVSVGTVAVVGELIGTREVAAYVVVEMLVNLTNEFVGGFWNALTTLCSQAVGSEQNKLCGQYVQMALILYVSFSVPFMCLWFMKTKDVVLWFGFDEETARRGSDFAKVYVFAALVDGISETFHGLLDVIDLENYSTVMGISKQILTFVVVLQVAIFSSPELYHVGIIHLSVGVFFLLLNAFFITWKGWFKPYMSGMFGSFALTNYKGVWLMCKTALALSMGFLLTDGEWEIMTLFASFLGPAEVAAWSLIGNVWGAVEDLTEAIGDAAEVRCSFLLGCEKPRHARVSAYKSMLIATIASFFMTSILFTMGEDLATWLTTDHVLQRLIVDLLPLLGLGNITMTLGTVCWTLLGSQGRYRLATTVAFSGSWLVTIPLSAIASVVLYLNLQGQTAAMVIGYMVSGTINAYFLFRSDWEQLSHDVIECHETSPETSKGDGEEEDGEKATNGQISTPSSPSSPSPSENKDETSFGSKSVSPDRIQILRTP